jgi:hypothetical protein
MDMRLPESGSLLGSILSGLGASPVEDTGVAVASVTEPQLVEAIDAMARGDIEYVILENGDEFLQAAGEGPGPYALQFSSASGDSMIEVPGGVDANAVRAALLDYRRGGTHWRSSSQWSSTA